MPTWSCVPRTEQRGSGSLSVWKVGGKEAFSWSGSAVNRDLHPAQLFCKWIRCTGILPWIPWGVKQTQIMVFSIFLALPLLLAEFLGLIPVLMIFYFCFAANKNTPAGRSYRFSFFFFSPLSITDKSEAAAPRIRQLIYNSVRSWTAFSTGLAAGLTGFLSLSQFGLWLWLRPGDCSETAEIPALFPGLFFFFVSKCEKENRPLIILLIFGLGKAALGLRRLTNQPRPIHQMWSFPFCECKCKKMLLREATKFFYEVVPHVLINCPLILIVYLCVIGHLFIQLSS